MTTHQKATIEDLYRVPEKGKAELVNGVLVIMQATGDYPARAGGSIYASLRQYERRTRPGYAYPDNAGSRSRQTDYLPTR
jgi:Uma2 family endonuclease